tara:strand:+ start:2371 stop:3120 length:750 start_codon:yes stop_codon:yes gene_type:complete
MNSTSSKVAIVTGASRGIGLEICKLLLHSKYNLIINSSKNNKDAFNDLEELANKYGQKVKFIVGDISSIKTIDEIIKITFDKYKSADVLVNNAGILDDAILGMISEESYESTLSINLKAAIFLMQGISRLMKKKKAGSIINISSIIGTNGNKGQVVYSSSKAGLIGATLSASKELSPYGIRVNAVAPGFIETDMVKQLDKEKYDERISSIPMGRIGTPKDVANLVMFLASSKSEYITGQIIGVDGGMQI